MKRVVDLSGRHVGYIQSSTGGGGGLSLPIILLFSTVLFLIILYVPYHYAVEFFNSKGMFDKEDRSLYAAAVPGLLYAIGMALLYFSPENPMGKFFGTATFSLLFLVSIGVFIFAGYFVFDMYGKNPSMEWFEWLLTFVFALLIALVGWLILRLNIFLFWR